MITVYWRRMLFGSAGTVRDGAAAESILIVFALLPARVPRAPDRLAPNQYLP
jgi:hypothetical protein